MKDINKRLEVLEETMDKMQEVIDDIRREMKRDPALIAVGDVVRLINDHDVRYVVCYVNDDVHFAGGVMKNGAWTSYDLDEIEKTGEHIWLVDELLALLKEGEE